MVISTAGLYGLHAGIGVFSFEELNDGIAKD
jgi:hypothetical protein